MTLFPHLYEDVTNKANIKWSKYIREKYLKENSSDESLENALVKFEKERKKSMYDKCATHISEVATGLLKNCMDDYTSRIWAAIERDVVNDILECSGVSDGEGITDGDVALSLGRVLYERLRIKPEE